MKQTRIAQIKRWREEIGAAQLITFSRDRDGTQNVATHGETERDAEQAAKIGNKMKELLNWADERCHDKPLARLCKNCSFYRPTPGSMGYGEQGWCLYEPSQVSASATGKCHHFEPNR